MTREKPGPIYARDDTCIPDQGFRSIWPVYGSPVTIEEVNFLMKSNSPLILHLSLIVPFSPAIEPSIILDDRKRPGNIPFTN